MLQLYVDYVSQPCRALALVVRSAGLPVDLVRVSLARRDHKAPSFARRFPLGKLPVLYDASGAGLALPESQAILRYLQSVAPPARPRDAWWPCTPHDAARADAALCWAMGDLRPAAAGLVWSVVLAPTAGAEADAGAASRAAAALQSALATLETVWLASGACMAGLPTPTAADVFAVCELDQLALLPAGAHGAASFLAPCPRVRAWHARVTRALDPHYGDVTAPLRKAVARLGGGGWWGGGAKL